MIFGLFLSVTSSISSYFNSFSSSSSSSFFFIYLFHLIFISIAFIQLIFSHFFPQFFFGMSIFFVLSICTSIFLKGVRQSNNNNNKSKYTHNWIGVKIIFILFWLLLFSVYFSLENHWYCCCCFFSLLRQISY